MMAVVLAEFGVVERAATAGLFRRVGHPEAEWRADHFDRYVRGGAGVIRRSREFIGWPPLPWWAQPFQRAIAPHYGWTQSAHLDVIEKQLGNAVRNVLSHPAEAAVRRVVAALNSESNG